LPKTKGHIFLFGPYTWPQKTAQKNSPAKHIFGFAGLN
jgi:hypothetical protein